MENPWGWVRMSGGSGGVVEGFEGALRAGWGVLGSGPFGWAFGEVLGPTFTSDGFTSVSGRCRDAADAEGLAA